MSLDHRRIAEFLEMELERARASYRKAGSPEGQVAAGRVVAALTILVRDAKQDASRDEGS